MAQWIVLLVPSVIFILLQIAILSIETGMGEDDRELLVLGRLVQELVRGQTGLVAEGQRFRELLFGHQADMLARAAQPREIVVRPGPWQQGEVSARLYLSFRD